MLPVKRCLRSGLLSELHLQLFSLPVNLNAIALAPGNTTPHLFLKVLKDYIMALKGT